MDTTEKKKKLKNASCSDYFIQKSHKTIITIFISRLLPQNGLISSEVAIFHEESYIKTRWELFMVQ